MRTRCSTRSSRVMENYRVDFQTIKARYNAAFDAYQLVAKRNAERALGGGNPDPAAIGHEKIAFATLQEARRALWGALGPTTPSSS